MEYLTAWETVKRGHLRLDDAAVPHGWAYYRRVKLREILDHFRISRNALQSTDCSQAGYVTDYQLAERYKLNDFDAYSISAGQESGHCGCQWRLGTSDVWIAENLQVVTTNFGGAADRFVIDWYSLWDDESGYSDADSTQNASTLRGHQSSRPVSKCCLF